MATGVGTVATGVGAAGVGAAGVVALMGRVPNSSCDSFLTTVVYLRISWDNVEVICSDECNNRKHVN